MKRVYFDIETIPLPREYLETVMPEFEPPANYKDPQKIAEKLEEKKEKWIDSASLNPLYSQIATSGYQSPGEFIDLQTIEDNDKELVKYFLDLCKQGYEGKIQIIGWNILDFDVPYIIRRGWKYGFDTSRIKLFRNRYWPEYFIDLRHIWSLGQYQCPGNLGEVAQYLGYDGKNGDGAEFHKLFNGTEDDRLLALAYAINDVKITHDVGEHLFKALNHSWLVTSET